MSGTDFDPLDFAIVEPRTFEQLRIGEVFRAPSRTLTDAHASAFQAVSADNHPVHYDVEYCRAHGMPHMLAHGYQVVIQTAAGAGLFPHMVEESLKGFLEQGSRFLNPVFVGDTLYCTLTVSELRPGNTTGVITLGTEVKNQKGEVVMDGFQKYLLRKRRP